MIEIKIPEILPQCNLIKILNERIKEKHDTQFNYFGRLDEFRQRVTGEIRYINQLFPEWTPHDEEYHIKRLFFIADTILGETINELNSSELIILALSLYGHDWGMAVNEIEKEYITTGKLSPGNRKDDLWTLDDDNQRFIEFIKTISKKQFNELTSDKQKNVWREYVRRTHAFRSGERIRKFFSPIDNGIAESVARVCESHALSFEDLDDENSYSVNFSVLGENVNLRALAIYLRLIDLFDLSAERTPYVIWKFVAPRDPFSQMEWAKHRSLQEITCPPYQNGRIIRVDGSTSDQDVFAELEDLKNYCHQELRGSNDILARMNDPRHKLNIYHIDWRVIPRSFKGISIKFEFDRLKMFEILGSEIYEDDPYVFLRELLQNSIDAIRTREAILDRKKISCKNITPIRVEVKHKENGDAIVTWQDDGIGMDEYIVRNYLSVAGKSYYTSDEFKREGLNFDPISRFGIGIFSCFMVSDKIEILTYKEPHSQKNSKPLKITIPDKSKNFRIEELSPDTCDVGTKITVYIKGEKLPTDEKTKTVKPLEVTRYLSTIAGFVDYPIIISERGQKSVILHPKYKNDEITKMFGKEYAIKQLDYSYPWSSVFLPQDLDNAKKFLVEKKFDISLDLGVKGYEGTISFVIPNALDIILLNRSPEIVGVAGVLVFNPSTREKETIKWNDVWEGGQIHFSFYEPENLLSRSGFYNPKVRIFRDGILIPDVSHNKLINTFFADNRLPTPTIIINIPKSKSSRINLARTTIIEKNIDWFTPVFDAYLSQVYDKIIKTCWDEKPEVRWYNLGWYSTYYHIHPKCILRMAPRDKIVIPFLSSKKIIDYKEWKEIQSKKIFIMPACFDEIMSDYLDYYYKYMEKYPFNIFEFWKGEDSAIDFDFSSRIISRDTPIDSGLFISSLAIHSGNYFKSIKFIEPPSDNCPPIIQQCLDPIDPFTEEFNFDSLFNTVLKDPARLTSSENTQLNRFLERNFPAVSHFTFIEFPEPFNKKYAYSNDYLNLSHPCSKLIIRGLMSFYKEREKIKEIDPIAYGKLYEVVLERSSRYNYSYEQAIFWIKRFFDQCKQSDLIDFDDLEKCIPTKDDFIPSAINSLFELYAKPKVDEVKPFGQKITK